MELFQSANVKVHVQDDMAVLQIDVADRPVNVFNQQVLADLDAALDRLAQPLGLKLLGIRSKKPSGFMAGADLHQFATIRTGSEATAISAAGQRLFDKLAGLPIPTVASIHGPCLGGGLEFALACDYRLVIDHPKTQLGLPEIELGLLPGWGGTQRLPRVIGLERALQVILGRRRLNAWEAFQWGLADAIAASEQEQAAELQRLTARAIQRGKRPKKGLPLRTGRQWLLESTSWGRAIIFRGAERVLRQRVPDDMAAPWEALHAVRVGLAQGSAAGLQYEREAIGRLATTSACRNLVTLFFLMDRARKTGAGEKAEKVEREIRRVGVVGAGTMGAGIAQLALVKGFDVVVQEIDENALAAGIQRIDALFDKAVQRRVLSADEARQKIAGLSKTTCWEGFAEVDVVIEAVIEDLEKKQQVFQELAQRTRPETILATNTSSLSIRQLQGGLQHPERVAGFHFFNPVHKMPLVEVIRAPATDARALEKLILWAVALGKTPVVVEDSPGFIVNRILTPYLNEAGMLVSEGMPIDAVDQAMRRFGMPVGPLELLDQVGLDVAAHIARAMRPFFGSRLTPHPALERMCEWGWLGLKSGAGFYRYKGQKKTTVNVDALAKLQTELQPQPRSADRMASYGVTHEAVERMVMLTVNEATACLGEGLAPRADIIDLAMVLGTGWAPHRGGPLRYADDRGAADVVKSLSDLAQRIGPRFEPCGELRRRAAACEPFYGPRAVPQLA